MLHRWQSGFRKNHSKDTSLLYLVDEILVVLDFDLLFEIVLIDLQKAYGAINH